MEESAKVVSISLTEHMLKDINELQREFGFSGRSEVIRAGIRMLLADKIEKERMVGNIGCILVVTHNEEDEESTKIKLRYEDIIKTHLHCKLKSKKCLELFVIEGLAEKIQNMVREFQANDGMEHVKLVVT